MALTSEEYVELAAAGLVELFARDRVRYVELAGRARAYAASYLTEAGLPVRLDDVAQVLEPALHVQADLRDHLAGRRLTQKYWYRRFGDLVIEAGWPLPAPPSGAAAGLTKSVHDSCAAATRPADSEGTTVGEGAGR